MFLLSLLFSQAIAADFPLAAYREYEVRAKVLVMGKELGQKFGRGQDFDTALALQECDPLDRSYQKMFSELKSRREKAASTPEAQLISTWKWENPQNKTLADVLKQRLKDWPARARQELPCNDDPSLELVENLVTDSNAADDPPMTLCIRLVKAFRKSGECGKSRIPLPKS
jgi:hypothetical protein